MMKLEPGIMIYESVLLCLTFYMLTFLKHMMHLKLILLPTYAGP